jgi:hypothetical protein
LRRDKHNNPTNAHKPQHNAVQAQLLFQTLNSRSNFIRRNLLKWYIPFKKLCKLPDFEYGSSPVFY